MSDALSDPSQSPPPAPVVSPGGNRTLALLGVLGIALLIFVGGGVALAASQAGQPGQTLASFCGDLTHQRYADAYGLLSSGAQSQAAKDEWIQQQQLHDQIDGQARTCTAGQASGGWLTFAHAGAAATVQLSRTKSYSGLIVLAHQADGWKVDKIDPRLQGTDLAPLQLVQRFCAALAKQDFAAAYADLSSGQQASVSQADFAKAYTQSLSSANAKLTGCTPDVKNYSVQGPSAHVNMALQVQVPTASGPSTVAAPFSFTVIEERAGWKIDDIKASGQ